MFLTASTCYSNTDAAAAFFSKMVGTAVRSMQPRADFAGFRVEKGV